jgi:hypothetical protein
MEFRLAKELKQLIENGLTAINVASPSIARLVRRYYPDIEIQTSCNTFGYIDAIHNYWHSEFGTTLFNLPREAPHTPWLLEDFGKLSSKLGYESKCIVNDGCLYGCPSQIEHGCSTAIPQNRFLMFCERPNAKLMDIFKTNFVPPHRLAEFEGKFTIAKLAGRTSPTQKIFKAFVAYINGDENCEISLCMHGRLLNTLKKNRIKIYAKDWPKTTLTCERKKCDSCVICQKAMEKVLINNGLDPSLAIAPVCDFIKTFNFNEEEIAMLANNEAYDGIPS